MSLPASSIASASAALVAGRAREGGLGRRGGSDDPGAWETAMEKALHSASFGNISSSDSPSIPEDGALRAGAARAARPAERREGFVAESSRHSAGACGAKVRGASGMTVGDESGEAASGEAAGSSSEGELPGSLALAPCGPRGLPGAFAQFAIASGLRVDAPSASAPSPSVAPCEPVEPLDLAWAGSPSGDEASAATAPGEETSSEAPAEREGAVGGQAGQAHEPVRWHVEWAPDGLRLWLGVDRDTSLALPSLTEQLLRELGPLLNARGTQLVSLVCNGRTVHGVSCEALPEGADAAPVSRDGPISDRDVGDVLSRISIHPKEVPPR